MKISNELSQISAELLLNYFYPELQEKWTARHEGTFYRNYNTDALLIREKDAEVLLARDGFLKLLPEGLLFDEDDLRKKNFDGAYSKLEQRRRLFTEAFLPLDTFQFRNRLHIEKHIADLLNVRLEYVLKKYYNFDINAEQNPYVKDLARLLPYISKWRADYNSIASLLSSMFKCKTKLKIGRYSEIDSTRFWMPKVEFQLLIPDLSSHRYQELHDLLQPVQAFLIEWFIPAEVKCEVSIKHHGQPQQMGKMVLDYNTEV